MQPKTQNSSVDLQNRWELMPINNLQFSGTRPDFSNNPHIDVAIVSHGKKSDKDVIGYVSREAGDQILRLYNRSFDDKQDTNEDKGSDRSKETSGLRRTG